MASTSYLVPLAYAAGIVGTLGAGLGWARKFFRDQRDKWTTEGRQQADLADKLDSNTRAANNNTLAIDRLSGDMRDFAASTRTRLDNHEGRLNQLEKTRSQARRVLVSRVGCPLVPEVAGRVLVILHN